MLLSTNDCFWPIAAVSETRVCVRIRGGSVITRGRGQFPEVPSFALVGEPTKTLEPP